MDDIPTSFKPLRYGSRASFMDALTELRYIEKSKGKLGKDELSQVSTKYQLPVDFLKAGLKGLQFPDDFIISESRWFPILYRWAAYREDATRKLILLTTHNFRARFLRIIAPLYTVSILLMIVFYLQRFSGISYLDMFFLLVLPVILFIIPLIWEIHRRVSESKIKLDQHIEYMNDEGLTEIVLSFKQFTERNFRNYRTVLYAGHILASKPLITLFRKGIVQTKAGAIPVFYAENPHLDYRRRLSKFLNIQLDAERSDEP